MRSKGGEKAAVLGNAVKPGEENALKMLVKPFDWLDGLEPRETTGIVAQSHLMVLDPVEINSAISCSPVTRICFSFLLGIGDEEIVASQIPMALEVKEAKIALIDKDPWQSLSQMVRG